MNVCYVHTVLLPIRYGRNGAHFIRDSQLCRFALCNTSYSIVRDQYSEGPSADGESSLTETCDSDFRISKYTVLLNNAESIVKVA